jgi:hypothetical protein
MLAAAYLSGWSARNCARFSQTVRSPPSPGCARWGCPTPVAGSASTDGPGPRPAALGGAGLRWRVMPGVETQSEQLGRRAGDTVGARLACENWTREWPRATISGVGLQRSRPGLPQRGYHGGPPRTHDYTCTSGHREPRTALGARGHFGAPRQLLVQRGLHACAVGRGGRIIHAGQVGPPPDPMGGPVASGPRPRRVSGPR